MKRPGIAAHVEGPLGVLAEELRDVGRGLPPWRGGGGASRWHCIRSRTPPLCRYLLLRGRLRQADLLGIDDRRAQMGGGGTIRGRPGHRWRHRLAPLDLAGRGRRRPRLGLRRRLRLGVLVPRLHGVQKAVLERRVRVVDPVTRRPRVTGQCRMLAGSCAWQLRGPVLSLVLPGAMCCREANGTTMGTLALLGLAHAAVEVLADALARSVVSVDP